MTMITKALFRLGKPGVFSGVLVGIAITAAAAYTQKLVYEYEEADAHIGRARVEIDELKTERASVIVEIDGINRHRDVMLQALRQEVLASMAEDIEQGVYDEAVNARAMVLAGHRTLEP